MFCPNCEKEEDVKFVQTNESINVRGEEITVPSEYYTCLTCNEDFEDTRGLDSLALAYQEYRRRKNMLQPEEIIQWRKSIGLTQKELSDLLGWGDATLIRYENGALQTEANERILRLIMEPSNFFQLIINSTEILNESKKKKLIDTLLTKGNQNYFENIYKVRFGNYSPDEFSGNNKLSLEKFFNVILFLCKDGQYKTKLNKLVFYVDFKNFKEHKKSITGSHYIHRQYGPVPSGYDHYFAALNDGGALRIEEEKVGNYIAEKYISNQAPNLSIFSDSELKTLNDIKVYFENFSASEIKDFSHEEVAYTSTSEGEMISYRFADKLKV